MSVKYAGRKVFHFPADPQLHARVQQTAAAAHLSMAKWIEMAVRAALEDGSAAAMMRILETKLDHLTDLIEGER